MALYAIGDVQGCCDALEKLLDHIRFNPANDHLWFTGDLVNRGNRSADVLRLVKSLGRSASTVLGNHDLHLLAVDNGARSLSKKDTLSEILSAPDRDELLQWLIQQPLLVEHEELDYVVVHAGIYPVWSLSEAKSLAGEVEQVLRSEKSAQFFRHMYGDRPDKWSNTLQVWDRLRFIVNSFTRMRFCTPSGVLDSKCKGPPGSQTKGLIPWFEATNSFKKKIVFGHWSTLGLYHSDYVLGLDTGCLWGGRLSAARLTTNDVKIIFVNCPQAQKPGNILK